MKVTILVENTKLDNDLIAEHGFSCFIEVDKKRILFDTGQTGIVVENAKKLNVDLTNLDYIILSHGHYDHVNGLPAIVDLYKSHKLKKWPIIIAHPDVFLPRRRDGVKKGSSFSKNEIEKLFEIKYITKPFWITDAICISGEIPRKNSFENKKPLGEKKVGVSWQDDFVKDEISLFCKSEDGIVIISGCSHPGIINTICYSKKICKDEKILDVIGGLHLKIAIDDFIEKTLLSFQSEKVSNMHACHCTGKKTLELLEENSFIQNNKTSVGTIIKI